MIWETCNHVLGKPILGHTFGFASDVYLRPRPAGLSTTQIVSDGEIASDPIPCFQFPTDLTTARLSRLE